MARTIQDVLEKIKEFPEDMRGAVIENTEVWSNEACYGYCKMALQEAGVEKEQAEKILRLLDDAVETWTQEAAEEEAQKPYSIQ